MGSSCRLVTDEISGPQAKSMDSVEPAEFGVMSFWSFDDRGGGSECTYDSKPEPGCTLSCVELLPWAEIAGCFSFLLDSADSDSIVPEPKPNNVAIVE